MEKYTALEITNECGDNLIAYPDKNGIETRDMLERWELRDRANNHLYFAETKKEAWEIRNSLKPYKYR